MDRHGLRSRDDEEIGALARKRLVMTSGAHGLQLRGVSKRFGSVSVVQALDLVVQQGEFVVLLGESGCGKSTVLRMIAGLEEVNEGQIFIKGRDVTHLPPKERDIAMVFQNYALYPHMDVAQNMSFALDLAGRSAAEIERRVGAAAEVLNISHLLQRKPKELSGGQRQRVAIGRCIVREPSVFLFDEPLSNLDAKLRGHMRAELALLHERLGKTTIYVTHDQIEAMTLASRIAIFHQGCIQQVGTPSEVFNQPANLFVASFIGTPSMNLLEGEVVSEGLSSVLQGPGFAVPLGSGKSWPQRMVAGIEPQAMRPTNSAGMLRLQVDFVEYLGTESVLVGTLAGGDDARITAVVGGDRTDLLHKTVPMELELAQLHGFDKGTGLRIRV